LQAEASRPAEIIDLPQAGLVRTRRSFDDLLGIGGIVSGGRPRSDLIGGVVHTVCWQRRRSRWLERRRLLRLIDYRRIGYVPDGGALVVLAMSPVSPERAARSSI